MLYFIYGGSGSGKSALAERLLQGFQRVERRLYIATMRPFDAEARQRIKKHRAMRAGKGFETIECYTGLAGLALPAGSAVLLECLGNLVANESFDPEGAGARAGEAVWAGIDALRGRARELVVVSNDVGRDGVEYPAETRRYQRTLEGLNRRLAAESDFCAEMVCGIPVVLKGEALCPSCAR